MSTTEDHGGGASGRLQRAPRLWRTDLQRHDLSVPEPEVVQPVTGRNFYAPADVSLPTAVTAFPEEYVQAPRSWTERAYHNLIYSHEAQKGGHFAVWEQPDLFVAELREAFRSLR